MSAIILFRSMTHTQRGIRALRAGGIPATILKAPQGLSEKGCTYAAGVSENNLSRAVQLLDGHQIKHGRVFRQDLSGGYREVLI